MTNPNPKKLAEFTERLAVAAGEEIVQIYGTDFAVDRKTSRSTRIDVVTDADRASEELILSAIRSAYPDHDIVTEEQDLELTGSPWRWIVDPLDGTVNFSHHIPIFCVSIAVMKDDRLIAGVVRDPLRKETFSATAGGGAFLNGSPIRVSPAERLNQCVVATGFPYDRATSDDNNVAEFSRIVTKVQGIRRCGSAALDLSYVAAGRLDGFWELKLKPWDQAAGMLLVTEAGGIISDRYGNPMTVETPSIIAANKIIHGIMTDVLKPDNCL
jgi:myo-inositol-1(or 4)-monophosphatase